MATTQRPITEGALNEPAASAAWRTIPSWFLYGSKDKNIPPAAHAFRLGRIFDDLDARDPERQRAQHSFQRHRAETLHRRIAEHL